MEIKLVLHNERPVSWNKFYAGKHWTVRKMYADEKHLVVSQAIKKQIKKPIMFKKPVVIKVDSYFDKYPMDSDNVCIKLYIDELKGIFIKDDTHRYVRGSASFVAIDRKNPRVEITMTES